MLDVNFINLLILVLVAAAISYRISFLSKKSLGYFSLLQIVFLVILPGFVFIITYSYIQDILSRPINNIVFISDDWLINIFLLSCLFTYGGIAIHSVTKMLSDVLRYENSETAKINKHFHLVFSHNLIYSGALSALLSITLLEMNHVNLQDQNNMYLLFAKGLILGLVILTSARFYTKSKDEYSGNWSDLKVFFVVVWMSLVLLFYGIKRVNPSLKDYDLIFSSLVIFVLLAFVNLLLVMRRLKRGGFAISFRLGGKKGKILEFQHSHSIKKQSSIKK